MVVGVDVTDRVAVGHHVPVKRPRVAQNVLEQVIARTSRLPVHPVVSTHHGASAAVDDGGAEGGKIGVLQVVHGDVHIGMMTGRFRTAVHGKVLGSRDHVRECRIIALHALDKSHSELRCEVWIFAIGFLAPAPAWIAEDVEVG